MKWKQGVKGEGRVTDRRETSNERTIREYWDREDGSRYQRPPMRGEEALRRRNTRRP